MRSLERAEDIAPEAMALGIAWTWQDFTEFLGAIDSVPKGINYAASIGHSALRTWAMGERAFEGPASEDDLAAMAMELRAALRAGAAGFTTSRGGHATSDGRPVASRLAKWDEVIALVNILGRESEGVFQLAPERHEDPQLQHDFERRLKDLAVNSGAPIAFGIFAQKKLPGQLTTDLLDATAAAGGEMFGLTHSRGIMTAQSFQTHLGFDTLPEWQDVRQHPVERQKVMLQDPEVRQRLVYAAHHGTYGAAYGPEARKPQFDTMTVLLSAFEGNPTVADEARRRGVDPVEAMIDLALEHDFDLFFVQSLVPQDDELLMRVLRHPRTAMCFSDSGAHVSQVFDSSIYTHLLAYWVRERQAFTIEEAIAMITSRPAHVWRLGDRGRLAPGYAADIAVFDPETVAPLMPKVVHDLPGQAPRIEQRAAGFKATIVNGKVLTYDGQPSEDRPGRLLRRY